MSDLQRRADRMKEVVSALNHLFQADSSQPLIRFDPESPEVSLIHCYILCPVELGLEVRLASAQECGVSCFNRLRASSNILQGHAAESYFEFNMVSIN